MQQDYVRISPVEERRQRLLEHVRYAGFGSVGELAQLLRVSEMTVRRDIQNLASRDLVKQVHGGANARVDTGQRTDFRIRATRGATAKRAIAALALDYIRPRTAVALDSGTTTLELARLLPTDVGLHVVTHSLPALAVLSRREGIEVMSLGGALESHTQSFVGPMTLSAIGSLRFDTFFMTSGSVRDGSTYVGTSFDAEIKRALMDVCDRVVLLADSFKFTATSLFPVASLDRVDLVITDPDAPAEALEDLRRRGIDVVLTPPLTVAGPEAAASFDTAD